MIRSSAQYIKMEDVDVMIQIIMPAKDWKAFLVEVNDRVYPASEVVHQINTVLSKLWETTWTNSNQDKKSEDYASESNKYSNFERAAVIASWFDDPVDKVFAVLIGVKLARLAQLSENKKEPLNETVADTRLDLCTYTVLWMARHQSQQVQGSKAVNMPHVKWVAIPDCDCVECMRARLA